MEATKEQEEEATGLLNKILPPRLEDAGLEDCALPPESINEAFLKAATAVKSRATSIFTTTTSDDEDDEEEEEERPNCINDPWPTAKDVSDTVVPVSPCPELSDTLVVGGGDDVEEREGEKKGCVDGLKGLKIKEKVKNSGGNEEEEEERERERVKRNPF